MTQINPKTIVEKGILHLSNNSSVQQVGIDLSTMGQFVIEPGKSRNIDLAELIKLPDNVYATFTQRSSYSRRGIFMTTGIYDPGYEGTVGCTVYNMSDDTLTVKAGDRLGQMLFFEADAASSYDGKYQTKK